MNSMLLDASLMNLVISSPTRGGGAFNFVGWEQYFRHTTCTLELLYGGVFGKICSFSEDIFFLSFTQIETSDTARTHNTFFLMATVIIKLAININKLLSIQLL